MAEIHIGDILVEENIITREQLRDAISAQRNTGQRLGRVLIDKGYVEEDELYRVLGEQLDSVTISEGVTRKKIVKYIYFIFTIQILLLGIVLGASFFVRGYFSGTIKFLTDDDMLSYSTSFMLVCIVMFSLFSFGSMQIYKLNNEREI
jgi:hypothetical protein